MRSAAATYSISNKTRTKTVCRKYDRKASVKKSKFNNDYIHFVFIVQYIIINNIIIISHNDCLLHALRYNFDTNRVSYTYDVRYNYW